MATMARPTSRDSFGVHRTAEPIHFTPSVRIRTSGLRGFQQHLTPPETPQCLEDSHQWPQQHPALFHNYLRAFHLFTSLSTSPKENEPVFRTVSIKPGDLILVHSIHQNGWADGTVLNSCKRGWLPTNYCEAYHHPHLRGLLHALTHFYGLLGATEQKNLAAFVREDYVRGLIAGVRFLLERADCLHRDAGLVKRHAGIRRMRKGLLADLSSLIQIAKRLQETTSEPFASEVTHVLLDDLIAKSFKVATRAVSFVDVWECEVAESEDKHADDVSTQESATPPEQLGPPNFVFAGTDASNESDNPAVSEKENKNLESRNGTSPAHKNTGTSSTLQRRSMFNTDQQCMTMQTSQELATLNDLCISNVGAFVGVLLQSRAIEETAAAAQCLVQACGNLLAMVEMVHSRDKGRFVAVEHARVDFRTKLDDFIRETQDIFRVEGVDSDIVMAPERNRRLVALSTNLIRATGECVVKTRSLIEWIRDYDLSVGSAKDTAPSGGRVADFSASNNVWSGRIYQAEELPRSNQGLSWKGTQSPSPDMAPHLKATDTWDFATIYSGPVPASLASRWSRRASVPPSPSDLQRRLAFRISGNALHSNNVITTTSTSRMASCSPRWKGSVGVSVTGSNNTQASSTRDSDTTAASTVSSTPTTPDHCNDGSKEEASLPSSSCRVSSVQSSTVNTAAEGQLVNRTYADELSLNKDGQVNGGSLPALVEQLTLHDATPDPQFVSSFYITFRLFTTPRDLVQALLDRFDYIGDSKEIAAPVKLRIVNVLKGWIETYWDPELDKTALGDIRYFAIHKLKPCLPSVAGRLLEIIRKLTAGYRNGTLTKPLASGVSKTSLSVDTLAEAHSGTPGPAVSKGQLNILRGAANGGPSCSIQDFDSLELARQITLMASNMFCQIRAEELLSLEWAKKGTQRAIHVRSMCSMNTNLAHIVGDSVLKPEDAKERAQVIKQWSKIGKHCLDLNNYDSLMAIMCSLNSSVVQRLKRTWELVGKNTKARIKEMNAIVDHSHNHASLRGKLESPKTPCLPFLGIYLTDLTFVDAGNPKTRDLPGRLSESGEVVTVINFDKYIRMAKIISHLQKFQTQYRLQPVPEMQAWIETCLQQMRDNSDTIVTKLHRRSLIVEPKQQDSGAVTATDGERKGKSAGGKEKIELLFKSSALNIKQLAKLEATSTQTIAGAEEEKRDN